MYNRVCIEVFSGVDFRNVSVFCFLDVKIFVFKLYFILFFCYYSEYYYVKWYFEEKFVFLLSLYWIYRVWDFL